MLCILDVEGRQKESGISETYVQPTKWLEKTSREERMDARRPKNVHSYYYEKGKL